MTSISIVPPLAHLTQRFRAIATRGTLDKHPNSQQAGDCQPKHLDLCADQSSDLAAHPRQKTLFLLET